MILMTAGSFFTMVVFHNEFFEICFLIIFLWILNLVDVNLNRAHSYLP